MTKNVRFQGTDYEVPDWAKWIAQDGLGAIRVYECQPMPLGSGWVSVGAVQVVGGARAPMVLEAVL